MGEVIQTQYCKECKYFKKIATNLFGCILNTWECKWKNKQKGIWLEKITNIGRTKIYTCSNCGYPSSINIFTDKVLDICPICFSNNKEE